jgi:hypothetical protein
MVWAGFLGINLLGFPMILHSESGRNDNLIWVFVFIDSVIGFLALLKNDVYLDQAKITLICTPFSIPKLQGVTEIEIGAISNLTWIRGWRNGPKLEIEFKKGNSKDWVTISQTSIDDLDGFSMQLSKKLNMEIGKRWLL